MVPEAIHCLQNACNKFFAKKTHRNYVKCKWAFEWNKQCQKVLSSTYKTCCFTDVNSYKKNKDLPCATHGKNCKLGYRTPKNRAFE